MSNLRVGALVFSTDQGLGILAKSFFDAGILSDVLVVRHGRREDHPEWFNRDGKTAGVLNSLHGSSAERAMEFCNNLDVLLAFETPFIWELFPYCSARGVRTVLMPMYECTPDPLPYSPDALLCPSELDLLYYPPTTDRSSLFLPIPVPQDIAWRERGRADVFVANAGHGGLLGRNGTRELFESLHYVQSPIHLILRSQDGPTGHSEALPKHSSTFKIGNVTVDYRLGTVDRGELYREGDALIHPTRFDGLSLPLREARAAGMLVIAPDAFPHHCWLPNPYLIPVSGSTRVRVAGRCREVEAAVVKPEDIAATIDKWYNADISDYSKGGQEWSQANSWDTLRDKYLDYLRG